MFENEIHKSLRNQQIELNNRTTFDTLYRASEILEEIHIGRYFVVHKT